MLMRDRKDCTNSHLKIRHNDDDARMCDNDRAMKTCHVNVITEMLSLQSLGLSGGADIALRNEAVGRLYLTMSYTA